MSIFSGFAVGRSLPIARGGRRMQWFLAIAWIVVFAGAPAMAAEVSEAEIVGAAELGELDVTTPLAGTEATPATAASPTDDHGKLFACGIRLQDEIELVNVRNVCGCCDPARLREAITVENYAVCNESDSRQWQASDLQTFLNFNASVPTVIFIHGNQISPSDAKYQGLDAYRRIILHGESAPPIRFVIFSWPSAKISGLLRDVRVKAARTGPAGYQLAWLIDQMPAETPISLAGFSFGARIITGGLHILAGGSLGGGMCLSEHVHPHRPPMSVFMMASALHAHWLGGGQYHGLAMTQVSKMCLINNCKDRAMVYYDFIEPGPGGPQALGLRGPTCISQENARKIFQRDVSCYVGADHELARYMCAPGDAGLFWDYTLGMSVEK